MTREAFAAEAARLQAEGKRVVFTNGVFDILHVGHLRYLQQARALGDALFVGVNSDASVRRLNKGPERPINPGEERAELLLALKCVDAVCVFPEDTPIEILQAVRPDIHCKGGDYTAETLPETPIVRANGGEVVILPLVAGRSTTRVVEKLRR
jgi:D-glycero-beta-D-manno-heptose 1-phosphate adenylyltransferase